MEQSLNKRNVKYKTKTVERMLRINQPKSSSSPNVDLIRRLQQRILATNHPMFRLSIEDYENICKDDKDDKNIRRMARVFNTTIGKLRKICKKMHIFKEYINSSPETIKNKMKAYKMSIRDLPKDLRIKFTEVFSSLLPTKYVLRPWVLKNKNFKIEIDCLSENPNAIDYLTNNPELIHWGNLSRNPNAIELLKQRMIYEETKLTEKEIEDLPVKNKISWLHLSENPKAKELLEAKFEKERLLEDYDLAQEIRYNTFFYLNWRKLSANPCAIDLLRRNINKIDWKQLSINPNPEAVELLSLPENRDRLEWKGMPSNKNKSPIKLTDLSEDQNEIGWAELSRIANTEEAMKLLRKRAAYEDTLPEGEYKRLRRPKKINWYFLIINPAIFL